MRWGPPRGPLSLSLSSASFMLGWAFNPNREISAKDPIDQLDLVYIKAGCIVEP